MCGNNDPHVTRRTLLRASGIATAGLFASSAALARSSYDGQESRKAGEASPFQRFCERWLELAADYPDRDVETFPADEYLYRLSSAITTLGIEDLPGAAKFGWDKDGLRSGPVWGKGAIFLVEIQLDPGAVLRAHNHPSFNAVTMVTKGDCRYRHFEPVGQAPDYRTELRKPFQLQETQGGILKLGRMASLSRRRDNIHWFQAGDQGVTMVDFSMGFGGSSGDFSALDFDPKPLDAERRIFEGYWTGNPYRSETPGK